MTGNEEEMPQRSPAVKARGQPAVNRDGWIYWSFSVLMRRVYNSPQQQQQQTTKEAQMTFFLQQPAPAARGGT